MPIVDGKTVIPLGAGQSGLQYKSDKKIRKKSYVMVAGHGRKGRKYIGGMTLTGDSIDKVEKDLWRAREHFGLNISDTLRIALRLTVKAIEEGRFNVA